MKEYIPILIVVILVVIASKIVPMINGKDADRKEGRPWYSGLIFAAFWLCAALAGVILKKDLLIIILFCVLCAANLFTAVIAKTKKR